MCGIAGFTGRGDEAILAAMTRSLAHRGPDGEGSYCNRDRAVFLGHRRLAVIDPEYGHQPMWNEDGRVGIVFNGMIYNHSVLRTELVERGHAFASDHSDTEVLVHGWEEWGVGLLERLNGMFAFALLDLRTGKLVLARDRFGEKPLFYSSHSSGTIFGSELEALQIHPRLSGLSMDPAAVRKYLAYGFFPAPLTPYREIEKLPQGHVLEIDLGTQETRLRRYWRFAIEPDAQPQGDPARWAEELDHLIGRAVASRLDSDRPLGIFLSGGIDSSTILSHAADVRPAASIETFSIGFTEASFDESVYATRMAEFIGSRHRTKMCDIDDARTLIADLPSIIDEPLADSSILPTHLLSRFAREHVTVALSGDGGDELFAGYDPFKVLGKARFYRDRVPRPIHAALVALAARLPISERNMSLDFKLNRGLRGLGFRPALWNPTWLGPASLDETEALFAGPIDPEDLYSEAISAWDSAKATSDFDRTLEFYTNFYLPDNILVKSDRASMRVGLEVRAPFLDNDIVDYACRLPAHAKFRHGTTKWILKQASARRLPADILSRRKKGFGIPIAKWLKDIPLDAFDGPTVLNPDVVGRFWREHRDGRRDHRGALWCALTLKY